MSEYRDFQILSPDAMEKMARAYHEKLSKSYELSEQSKQVICDLLFYYRQLKKHSYTNIKIATLNKIYNYLAQYCEINSIKCVNSCQILSNTTENYLVRKIINNELRLIKLNYTNHQLVKEHVENITKLMECF